RRPGRRWWRGRQGRRRPGANHEDAIKRKACPIAITISSARCTSQPTRHPVQSRLARRCRPVPVRCAVSRSCP
ncbi:hypothetical protein HK405_010025, partial [Cladochytrium tenue]